MGESEKPVEKPKKQLLLGTGTPTPPNAPPPPVSTVSVQVATEASHALPQPEISSVVDGIQEKARSDLPYKLDLFVAFISALFPFGWSVSGFPPNIILACVCWGITLACVLHYLWTWSHNAGKLKGYLWFGIVALPLFIVIFAWRPVVHQYRIQHSPASSLPTDTNTPAAVTRIENKVDAMAANKYESASPEEKLAMLGKEKRKFVTEGSQLAGKRVQIEVEPTGINRLNDLIANDLEKEAFQSRQVENDRKAEAVIKQLAQKQTADRNANMEKAINDENLEIYDYAIRKLAFHISAFATESGQKEMYDFTNGPTIHVSNMVKDGTIINGSNFICLGTNSAWKFSIETVGYPPMSSRGSSQQSLRISCKGKDGEAIVSIINNEKDETGVPIPGRTVIFDIPGMSTAEPLYLVHAPTKTFDDASTNDKIDKALDKLLTREQKQFPLHPKNN